MRKFSRSVGDRSSTTNIFPRFFQKKKKISQQSVLHQRAPTNQKEARIAYIYPGGKVAPSRFSSWYHLYLPRPRPEALSHPARLSFVPLLSPTIVYLIFISDRLTSDFIWISCARLTVGVYLIEPLRTFTRRGSPRQPR